jgi:phosphatidate cytidylyltransferase
LFAIPALALLFCVLWFMELFARIAVSLVGLICMFEMLRALSADGAKPVKSAAYVFSALTWPVYEYVGDLWRFDGGFRALAEMLVLAVMAIFLILVLTKRRGEDGIRTVYALIYPGLFYAFLLAIICIDDAMAARFMFLLVFVGASLTDVFAYFGGSLFGRHKLVPEISPKKTMEGAVIGGVFGLLGVLLTGILFQQYFGLDIPVYLYAILGALLGILSQVGDLTASIVKRQFGVKDYSSIMGAHGGVMDRLDSVIFVSPIVCAFYYIFVMVS